MNGRKPTAAEKRYLDSIVEIGCIVCRLHLKVYSPCEVHHISGGQRKGAHFKTIGLCAPHHRHGFNNEKVVSRHPYKKRFEQRYGDEGFLLEETKKLITEGHWGE